MLKVPSRNSVARRRRLKQEIELKLELPQEAVEAFERSALLPSESEAAQLRSTYFDTPDRQLQAHGFSLRIRRSGDDRVQTVKAGGDAGGAGLFARAEWEMPVTDDAPVIDARTPIAELLREDVSSIAPIFDVDVERRTWRLSVDGSRIELVLDRGRIGAGERQAPICEIELELQAGEPAALFALARKIAMVAPVRPGVAAKSERGYRLLDAARGAFKAEPVALKPGVRTEDAFQTIARACLRHYRLNEALLFDHYDPQALHQARVAVRRLRSAFTIFKAILAERDVARFQGELRWLAGMMSDARNLDVLAERTEAGPLRDRLEEARTQVQAKVRDALLSDRARGLLLDLVEWLALGAGPCEQAVREELAERFAARRLQHFHRRVAKGGRRMERLTDEARHEVRKDAKKLRYASDFFAGLFATGKKQARRREKFISALAGLQDDLGALNDLVSTPEILERHGLADQAEDRARLNKRKKKLVGAAVRAHGDLTDARRFWR